MLRALSTEALAAWERLEGSACWREALARGDVPATVRCDPPDGAPESDGWAAWLEHERLPCLSWPGEWCFEMLQDAARLQLALMRAALADDLILSDGSAYNVQFRGSRPVFVDVGSFVPYRPGAPWEGYRQFLQTCLYPLLLTAWRGVDARPWLNGSLEGIDATAMARLLGPWQRLRPAALVHVTAAAALQRRAGGDRRDVRGELAAAGFAKELVLANVTRLSRLVDRLRFDPGRTTWSHYAETCDYDQADGEAKRAFVEQALARTPRRQVLDLGANTGEHARLAARHASSVVAVDGDVGAVSRLYRALRDEGDTTILPLVVDLLDPTPARGWRLSERASLAERVRPDLTLALALVHHLSIAGQVPLPEVVEALLDFGPELVVEWVDATDPRAAGLLARKTGSHPDYTRDGFEASLARRAVVLSRRELMGGRRVLYHLARRDG